MTALSDGERKIRLFALIASLERARREAKSMDFNMLAFLIGYAETDAQGELDRIVSREQPAHPRIGIRSATPESADGHATGIAPASD